MLALVCFEIVSKLLPSRLPKSLLLLKVYVLIKLATAITTRLVVSYFNWIWQHSRFRTTAAQRAGLTPQPWAWHDLITYPTIV